MHAMHGPRHTNIAQLFYAISSRAKRQYGNEMEHTQKMKLDPHSEVILFY